MAIKINFDSAHNAQSPTYLLITRSGRKICKLPAYDIVFRDAFNSYSEVFFRVNRIDCASDKWDQIKDFKLMYCPEYDNIYELYVRTDESDGLIKSITAKSLGEAELSQINLYDIEINTESDISREDYKPTVLHNKNDAKTSLLNRITEKAPHYKVIHVDPSIANIQRTFSFDGISIYDSFQKISQEIDCLFDINVTLDADGNMHREISVYDLESYCVKCGKRGEFSGVCPSCKSTDVLPGYGKDTTIFVSTNNLAENVQYSTNTDSVKNCFKLTAGDDLMTATIANCNPNGSGYIWYISDDAKKDMSAELSTKLNEYDLLFNRYQKEYRISIPKEFISQYNSLVDKYSKYSSNLSRLQQDIIGYPALMNAYYNTIDFYLFLNNELMPNVETQSTTAAKEVARLNANNLSPVSVQDIRKVSVATASSSVLSIAKTIVDSRYQVKIKDSSLSGTIWSGTFVVTNYSDDSDTATSSQVAIEINDNYESFIKQKIERAIHKYTDEVTDVSDLFKLNLDQFASELKKYSLSRLTAFHDACQTCIDILIEQGISDKETWGNKTPNLYETIYMSYYNKLLVVSAEIKTRESEISKITGVRDKDGKLTANGVQTVLEKERDKIHGTLNFQKYLGEHLWLEFSAYRREDTYQNDNYVSDGLNNAELFNLALEFIDVAKKEIYKSATLQHSITASLKNLLVMKEFAPIVENFEVGNWIRIRVDGNIYKLRILEYEIDYENLEDLQIVFSDVKTTPTGLSDAESVISQASSMASSYGSVSRQASHGNKGNDQISNWVNKGLALTKMKIVDSADNQNITWDSHGLLCREYLAETDSYDDKQLKIINRGLYLTSDGWKTSRAGIGSFTFYNPMSEKIEESYGVIADTLVGNLILSERVGVYSKDNSIVLGENGLVITTNRRKGDVSKNLLFLIQKNIISSDGQITNQKLMYVDDNGSLVLNGGVKINASSNNGIGSIDDLADDNRIDVIINNNSSVSSLMATAQELSSHVSGIEGNVSKLTQTADILTSQISTMSGNVSSITQKIDSIKLTVSNGDTSSTIQLNAGDSVISSQQITMSGFVTFSALSGEGQTTINGSNITTGTLSADCVKLKGKFSVYSGNTMGGYIGYLSGSTTTEKTDGIGVCNVTSDCYLVATDAGVAMKAGNSTFHIVKDREVKCNVKMIIDGDLIVNGNISSYNQ